MTQPAIPQLASKAKIFIFTGQWGGGKTVTALSFVPPTWTGDQPVKRIVIDPEMRADAYQSPDGKDYPEAQLYGFQKVPAEGRFDPAKFVALMKVAHNKTWTNGAPAIIVIDDAGIWQEHMFVYWSDKSKAIETAKIYGLDTRIRELNQNKWDPKSPGVLSMVFKRFFEEFILDLREQQINVIVTAPLHNVWQNYGVSGYAADGKPNMRVLGKSAKVLDIFVKHADAIWMLDRLNPETRQMSQLPTISMDPMNPKASFPGLPEKFEWPGWPTVWQWHRERKFKADVSKLFVPAPEFDQDSLERMTQVHKVQLYEDLMDTAMVDEIDAILANPEAPVYTVETHDAVVKYVKRVVAERAQTA